MRIVDPISQDDQQLPVIEYYYGKFNASGLQEGTGNNLGKVTMRDLSKVVYRYEENAWPHHLTGIYDNAAVNVLTAVYDSSDGRLNDLVDASSQTSDLQFNLTLDAHRTVTKVDADTDGVPDAEEVRNRRGDVLRRVQQLNPAETDPAAQKFLVTAFVYNLRGLLLRQSAPFVIVGAENRYDHAPVSDPDQPGYNRTDWAQINVYDGQGRVLSSTGALGATTSFTYDDFGRVLTTTDPGHNVSHNLYDRHTGQLVETWTDNGRGGPKFNRSKFEYHHGQLTATYNLSSAGEAVLVSSSQYDSSGRLKSTTDAAGVTRHFRYDANGNQTVSFTIWTNPINVNDKKTLATRTIYDAEGRATLSEEFEIDGNVSGSITGASYFDGKPVLASTTTHYDSQGRVEATEDRFGNRNETTFDIRDNVIQTRVQSKQGSDAGWIVTRTLYDNLGRVEFTTDPYFVTDAAYAATGQPWYGTRTVYDNIGRVIETRWHDGVRIDLAPHTGPDIPAGQQKSVIVEAEINYPATFVSASKTFYDDLGRVEYTESETGDRTDYYYDEAGRQIAELGPLVTVSGQGPVRHLSQSHFDPAGRLTQATTGVAITDVTNLHPDIADSTIRDDSLRQDTFYEYDLAGRQSAVVTTAVDHDQDSATPLLHLRSETRYDDFGRRAAAVTGLTQTVPGDPLTIDRSQQRETTYEYDVVGRLVAVNQPTVLLDNPQNPGAGDMIFVRPRYEYRYDAYGNRDVLTTNAYLKSDGTVVYLAKNPASTTDTVVATRPLSGALLSDPLLHQATTTRFTFDHRGRQTTRTLPEGVATTAIPDDFVESMTYEDAPASGVSSVGNGQLKFSVDFDGRVTAYLYDNSDTGGGQLVEKQFFPSVTAYNGGAGTPAEKVTYAYDAFGRETSVTFDRGVGTDDVTTNTYDEEGRLVRGLSQDGTVYSAVNHEYHPATGQLIRTFTENTSNATGNAQTDTRYVYDAHARLEHVVNVERFNTAVAGGSVDWINAAGQSVSITGDVASYAYDLLGNLARVTAANGLVTDYTYDRLNRLTRQVSYVDTGSEPGVFDGGDLIRGSYQYKLDLFGKRTQATEQTNAGATNASAVTSSFDWTYDELGRLTRETFDHDTAAAATAEDFVAEYGFDLVGNRVLKTTGRLDVAGVDETVTYYLDRNDRLRREVVDRAIGTDSTLFYRFDNGDGDADHFDGSVQSRKATYTGQHATEPATGATSTTTFSYNLQGRLAQSVADGVTYDYEYNDDGVRISQTVGGVKTIYVVDDNNHTGHAQVIEEKDAVTGTLTKTYHLGHDVLAQATAAAVAHYLLADGHGSTRALLDDTAAVVQNGATPQLFAYDAYGNLLDLSGFATAIEHSLVTHLYSGEQTDRAGAQYLRARYYDPSSGRFNRLDPFAGNTEDPQSLHKYLYTHGDPINSIDPSGQFISALFSVGFNFAGRLQKDGLTAELGRTAAQALGSISLGAAAGIGLYSAFGGDIIDGILYGGQLGAGLFIAYKTRNLQRALTGGLLEAFSTVIQEVGFVEALADLALTKNPMYRPKPLNHKILDVFAAFSNGVFQTARGKYPGGGTPSAVFDTVAVSIASDLLRTPRLTRQQIIDNAARAGGQSFIRVLALDYPVFNTVVKQVGADAALTFALEYFMVVVDAVTPFGGLGLGGDTSRYQ